MGQGAIMEELGVQYAVIHVSSSGDSSDRIVLAYSDEKSLYDLIARPSIIGLGFASREQALFSLAGEFHKSTVSSHLPTTASTREHPGFGLIDSLGLSKTRRIGLRSLQYAFAMGILLFYSSNIVSTTIRAALGSSL